MAIIFLHIPKAGGVTISSIFNRIYGKDVIYDIKPDGNNWEAAAQEFIELSPKEKQEIKVLRGHMHYGLHKYFIADSAKYITFLRDPVERIISHYYFVLRSDKHYLYDIVTKKKMTLLDYATSDLSWELDNGMTRSISGENNIQLNHCNQKVLDTAIVNLKNNFIFCGLTEKYDESVLLLKNKLGWIDYPFYRKLNTGKKKKAVSSKIKSIIARRNKYDVGLYNWAVNEFNDSINRMPDLQKELKILKTANISFREGFLTGHSDGYSEGYSNGFQKGYNKLFDKYPLLNHLRFVKSKFLKAKRP